MVTWCQHLCGLGFSDDDLSNEGSVALKDLESLVAGREGGAYLRFLGRFGEHLEDAPCVVSQWPRIREWVEITEWFGLRAPAALVADEWRLWQDRLPERLLPIGRDPGGARFCVDLNTGCVWFVCEDFFGFGVDEIDRFAVELGRVGVDASPWQDTRVALEYRMRIENLSFEAALSWGDVLASDFETFASNLRLQTF